MIQHGAVLRRAAPMERRQELRCSLLHRTARSVNAPLGLGPLRWRTGISFLLITTH